MGLVGLTHVANCIEANLGGLAAARCFEADLEDLGDSFFRDVFADDTAEAGANLEGRSEPFTLKTLNEGVKMISIPDALSGIIVATIAPISPISDPLL